MLWRSMRRSDVPALEILHKAVAQADHPNWVMPRNEIVEPFEVAHIDPQRDTLVAESSDGSIVAHGMVDVPPSPETIARAIILGAVHPEYRRRGYGGALLTWQLRRAEQHLVGVKGLPRWVMAYADERAPSAGRLLARHELRPVRTFRTMHRDLQLEIPTVSLNAGLEVRPWSGAWTNAARNARNDAFRDHWGSQPVSEDRWAATVADDEFAEDLSFLVVDTGNDAERVVGFLQSMVHRNDWEGQGFTSSYVHLVGTVRSHRGRGVARALLTSHLGAARRRGLERATLDVDSDNPSGAMPLYEGLGFEETGAQQCYLKTLE